MSYTTYTPTALIHVGFVNVLLHLFRKFLQAGGLQYSCHSAQASCLIEYGKFKSSLTKSLKLTE